MDKAGANTESGELKPGGGAAGAPESRQAGGLRLSKLPATLAGRFGEPTTASPDGGRKNAAVAVVLRPRSRGEATGPRLGECDVLVIQRASSRRDPWSGQMALPGGRLDPVDAGLVGAAVRETMEETGVDLGARGMLLGRIEAMRPLGVRIPTISIWPFVFQVDSEAIARVASPEVASVHWFPVEALVDRANRGTYPWTYGGVVRQFPCIRLEGRVIWGLTYRILTRLFEVAVTG